MVGPNIKRWPKSVGGDGSDFSFLLMCLTGWRSDGRAEEASRCQADTGHGPWAGIGLRPDP